MSNVILFGGLSFVLDAPVAPTGQRAPSPAAAIDVGALEHGVHYTGRLRSEASIARWHAKKQRFVHAEYAVGRQRVGTVEYVDDSNARDGFCPLSQTSPREGCRISDYAFETAR